MAFADGGAERLPGNGAQVMLAGVLVEAPVRRPAVPARDVGKVVLVAFARGRVVEAQQAAGESGDCAAVGGVAETAAIAARLLDRLRELGVGNIRLLALKHKPRVFELVISIDDEVRLEVRRTARNGDLKAHALRRVLVLVDEFGPQFGANLLLRVRPALGVIGSNVADTLALALAGELCVAVREGAFEVCFRRRVSHETSLALAELKEAMASAPELYGTLSRPLAHRRVIDARLNDRWLLGVYQLGLPSHAGLSVRRVWPEPSGFIA